MAHILVVDDERDVVQLIKFLLEKDGHEVGTAGNGAEALAVLGLEPEDASAALPNLVIIDVMMPVLDGHSACARLAQAPRTRALPVLVLTAKGDARQAFQTLPNVGACLDKPFDPGSLREAVARLLQAAGTETARG